MRQVSVYAPDEMTCGSDGKPRRKERRVGKHERWNDAENRSGSRDQNTGFLGILVLKVGLFICGP